MFKRLAAFLIPLIMFLGGLSSRPARAEDVPIGTNLRGIMDWSTELPFVEVFKSGRPLFSGSYTGWEDGRWLNVDEFGWVTRLEADQVARTLMCWGMIDPDEEGAIEPMSVTQFMEYLRTTALPTVLGEVAAHKALAQAQGLPLIAYESGNNSIAAFDNASRGFASLPWMRVPWAAYAYANGETRPCCGNLDGDRAAELVAGLGRYPSLGGYMPVFDDASTGFAVMRWIRVPAAAYDATNGETRPAMARMR